jgi:opacity protein-like surface antigen
MKKTLMITASVLALASGAQAADVFRGSFKDEQPVISEAAAKNWTGFYVGIEAGGGAGVYEAARNLEHGLDYWHEKRQGEVVEREQERILTDRHSDRLDLGMSGLFGGVNVEYKQQVGQRTVVGVFGNFDWGSMKGSDTYSREVILHGENEDFQLGEENSHVAIKRKWNGDLGVKLGFLPTSNTLVYGLVAASWGRFNVKGGSDLTLLEGEIDPFRSSFQNEQTEIGLKLGAGIETRLDSRWTLGVEGTYTAYEDLLAGFSGSNSYTLRENEFCADGLLTSTNESVKGDLGIWEVKGTLKYQIN